MVRRPPRWLSGKTSASKAADPRANPAVRVGLFAGGAIPVT